MDQILSMPEASNSQSHLDEDTDLDDGPNQPHEPAGVAPVETLGPAVQRILVAAADLAGGRGHTFVSADDLFAALVSSDCAAARLLESLSFHEDQVLDQLAFILGRNNGAGSGQATEISPRVDSVLSNARLEAGRRDAKAVDSLHLLSALLRERKGVPSLLLEKPGLGLEPVGAALNRAFREGQTDHS